MVTSLLEMLRHKCLKVETHDSSKWYNLFRRTVLPFDTLELSKGVSLGFDQELEVMLQFVDCSEKRSELADSEFPVDPQVHQALC